MPLSKRTQADILASDALRRMERELLDNARLGIDVDNQQSDRYKIAHAPKDSHVNPCLVKGVGMVSPPPKPRASEDCWSRGLNSRTTVGTADPTIKSPTVRVIHPDGTEEIVLASAFHTKQAKRTHRAKVAKHNSSPETARLIVRGMDWNN